MDRKFQNIVNQLTKSEQKIIEKNKIQTLDKLIPILLKRVPNENSENLIKTIMEALKPSISDKQDDDFDKLYEQLNVNPKLLFEIKTQETISSLIIKRINNDKKNLIKQTSNTTNYITSMQNELSEAISLSDNSSNTVHNLKDKIISVENDNTNTELKNLKEELIDISTNIEEEMCKVTSKLQKGRDKISELHEQVKNLELELKKTRSESKTDFLTGLLTRRGFNQEIEKFEDRFLRENDKYAIIFFDLDHFKKVNDTYGHDGGDVVLSTFAKILEKSTRKIDALGRYGGEEFVALIHYKDKKEVLDYANRVKNIIDNNSFLYKNQKIKVTFSAGIGYRQDFEKFKSALKHADDLLYEAKREGRNQIKY